ncbi:L-lactate permease [Salinithrix halophila]|uniref:L-lactate permease n=1 Tax=Salinithrix halophila TaxID=1485204 RepID=A0ABV8JNH7_9BACL
MNLVLSLLPILIVLVLLFIFKRSAVEAGVAACVTASVVSLTSRSFSLNGSQLLDAGIQGMLTTSVVVYVLIFGILLFHLMNEAGAIQTIAAFVAQATHHPTRQVLLLAVAFSPLLESASGFGLAMIVIAPILISLGFDRFKATLISLISLTAVPWGALATGTVIGANLADYPLQRLGTGSAILSVPTFFYFACLMVLVSGGFSALRKHFFEVLLVSSLLSGGIWFFNSFVSVELAGVFGAFVALAVELLFIRWSQRRPIDLSQKLETATGEIETRLSIFQAMSAYMLLIALLLVSRLVPSIAQYLSRTGVLHFPTYHFKLPLLYSPGFYLFLVCIFSIFAFKLSLPTVQKSIKQSLKQLRPVLLSTLGFVVMSQIMAEAGMTQLLSSSAALFFGPVLLYLSPVIGGLGGFLTGSNTGSNAMFIRLQLQTAQHLQMSPDLFAYAQNTSSSHLIMACPSRVLLAASIGGIPEQENQLLRTITFIGLGTVVLLILGILAAQWF